MMHRVTMRDGTVWFLEEDHDENPVRMTFYNKPTELPFAQWNHTPHSYVGSGSDLERLAMDIAKWAEMEEYLVAEIVPIQRRMAVGDGIVNIPPKETMNPRKLINEELIAIRKAMRRIERLLEDL